MQGYRGFKAARKGLASRLAILGAAMVYVEGGGSLTAEREVDVNGAETWRGKRNKCIAPTLTLTLQDVSLTVSTEKTWIIMCCFYNIPPSFLSASLQFCTISSDQQAMTSYD
jgi:hypothetical protein